MQVRPDRASASGSIGTYQSRSGPQGALDAKLNAKALSHARLGIQFNNRTPHLCLLPGLPQRVTGRPGYTVGPASLPPAPCPWN